MKLRQFSVAMALVPPLMDFSGPEFNVSLTYFPCLGAVSIPSVQPQSDVCDFSPKVPDIIQERENSALSYIHRDWEGETDQEQHFINQ